MAQPEPPAPTSNSITLEPVSGPLPADLPTLQADAAGEGYSFIDRLVAEWANGTIRFTKPGEALLIARHAGTLAGIGGITEDPYVAKALRMRRFYIRPMFRRRGIAQTLAMALLDVAIQTGRPLTVNAGTAVAPAFWEALGFQADPSQRHTHIWPTVGPSNG